MLEFKTKSLQSEFEQLKQKNNALAAVMECLAEFVYESTRKSVIVTHVLRSKQKQEEIYGKGTKRTSPHMVWKAVDIRDWIYTDKEKAKIIGFLKKYDEHNLLPVIQAAKSSTVWLHEVGKNGMHFHIQYAGPPVYIFTKGLSITA